MEMTEIETRFTYNRPQETQSERYAMLGDKAKEFAVMINITCPESREKSLAITSLEQAVMWSNASIARRDAV